MALLIVYAVRSLDLHPVVIGLVRATGQAAGILGAVLARRIAARICVGPTFIAAVACCGPATLLIAAARPDNIWGVAPIGALLCGALAATVGLRPTFAIAAAVAAVAFVPLLRSPAGHLRALSSPVLGPPEFAEPGAAVA